MKPRTRSLIASIWMVGSAITMVALGSGDAAMMWLVVFTPAMLIMPWSNGCCCCGVFKKRRAKSDEGDAMGSGAI